MHGHGNPGEHGAKAVEHRHGDADADIGLGRRQQMRKKHVIGDQRIKAAQELTLQSYSLLLPNRLELLMILKWDKVTAFGKPVVPWEGQLETVREALWPWSQNRSTGTGAGGDYRGEEDLYGVVT